MKLAVAQTRPIKGDIAANIMAHRELVQLAVAAGTDLLVFPELSITGYEPELAAELAFDMEDTRLDVFQELADLHSFSIGVGAPLRFRDGVSISLIIFQPGVGRELYSKQYLHRDEEPYFIPGLSTIHLLSGTIAPAICYELSVPAHAANAAAMGARVYIASAVKEVAAMERNFTRLSQIAREFSMITLLSNCVGISGGYACGGHSAIWDNTGRLISQLDDQREGILVVDTLSMSVLEKYA